MPDINTIIRLHPKEAGFHSTRIGLFCDLYRADLARLTPWADCRIDRVFRDISFDAEIVGIARLSSGKRPRCMACGILSLRICHVRDQHLAHTVPWLAVAAE